MPLRAITTVYSYRFPETRRAINTVFKPGFPHHVFTGSACPAGALDRFHEPVIQKVIEYHKEAVPALGNFNFRYPTSGSEEGIREILTVLQGKGVKKIYVLEGEYEGYREVGKTRRIEAAEVKPDQDPADLEPGFWFISNPSARDGNFICYDFIRAICDAGHQVFYDLAYLGSTNFHVFDLSHPNIFAAVVSFSKPFGLFYDRIGFTFSREPIDALYGNKWFKSAIALMIARAIMENIPPGQLVKRYQPVQREIIAGINQELGLGMRPSAALLLGHLTAQDAEKLSSDQKQMITPFKRGPGYRFCLTPYFFEHDPERNELFRRWYQEFLTAMQAANLLTADQLAEIKRCSTEWLGQEE